MGVDWQKGGRRLFAVVVGCAFMAGLTGCNDGNDAHALSGSDAPLVSVEKLVEAPESRQIELSGQVRSRRETALGFRVAGKIETRNVEAGQVVEKGDVLFSLDKADYGLRLDALKSQEVAAKARADNAADELTRHKRMLEKELISQAQFDRVQSSFDQAEAAYKAAVSARENAANDIAYTSLCASERAIVAELHGEVGQVVAAGQPVVSIAALNQMEAEVYLPEKFAHLVQIGSAGTVELNFLHLDPVKGEVREIAGSADARTRTYRTRIALVNAPSELRLGMSIKAFLNVPMPENCTLVPAGAICDGHDEKAYVWVLSKGDIARKRVVKVKGMYERSFCVQGLEPGESIVVDGARFLDKDQKVRVAGRGKVAKREAQEGGE